MLPRRQRQSPYYSPVHLALSWRLLLYQRSHCLQADRPELGQVLVLARDQEDLVSRHDEGLYNPRILHHHCLIPRTLSVWETRIGQWALCS